MTVASCAVTLQGDAVTVDWSLSAGGDAPALLVDGPRFGWMGASEPYPDRHFPELEILVDGKRIAAQERFEAFVGRSNITSLIRAARMDPWTIAKTPPLTSPHPDNPQIVTGLLNAGAIAKSDADPGDAPSSDYYVAKWTARRLLRIPLAPASQPRLQFVYDARPAFSETEFDQLFTVSRQILYCADGKPMTLLRRAFPRAQRWRVDEYTIPVGINGQPPLSVTLAILAEHDPRPAATTFACGSGGPGVSVSGNLPRRPVRVDQTGNLHILRVRAAAASP